MRFPAFALLSILVPAALLPTPVTAQIEAEPRIALHISPHATKAECSAETGAPTNLPCADFVTAGDSRTGYDVYIVAVRNDSGGISGAVFGLDYDPVAGAGIDVFGWTRCADLEFPTPGWPNAGAGTLLTWAPTQNCQADAVQGRVQAVAGFLYVYAYDADVLRITERLPVPEPGIELADCELSEFSVPATMRGQVALGDPEVNTGWNPCLQETACEASVSLLDFGTLPLGLSTERVFTVANPGNETFTIAPVAVGIGYAVIGGGEERVVAPGQAVTVEVRFTPVAEEDHVGYIDLQGGGCAPVNCIGRVWSACDLAASFPMSREVPINRSAVWAVQVTAEGEGIVSGVVSFDRPEFSVALEDPIVHVLPGDTQLIPVRFAPRTLGYRVVRMSISGTSCGTFPFAGVGIAPDSSCFLEPDFLDFGEVPVNESGVRLLKIIPGGTEVVSGSVAFDAPGFAVPPEKALVYAAPGDTLFLPVRFTPTHPGLITANLTISGTTCGSVLIAGTGTAADPRCDLEPGILDFGEVAVGDTGTGLLKIVAGDAEIVSGTVSLDIPEFSVPPGEDLVYVLPGDTLFLPVQFSPTLPGPVLGNLTIQGTVCRSAVLMGEGVPTEPGCDVAPTVLDFGTSGVNVAVTRILEITSTGSEALSGNAEFETTDFSVSPGDAAIHVPPGDTLSLSVRFAPGSPGYKVDRLTIGGTSCGPVVLNGTGFADCGVHPDALDYGAIPLGGWRDLSLRITNQGSLRFRGSVLLDCSDFTVVTGGGPYDLGAGESRDVVVRFNPVELGAHNCSLDLDGGCGTIPLMGIGIPGGSTDVSALDFGEMPVGGTRERRFTILNSTDEPMSGIVASSAAPFSVLAGGGNYSLDPGQSREVTVQFAPTTQGFFAADITYSPFGPAVRCSGTGISPAAGSDPMIALHLSTHQPQSGCTAAQSAPTTLPCADFTTTGDVGTGYDVYLVAVRNPPGGIAGLVFGIDYDGAPGTGVDIFGWNACADLQFPTPSWPAAESGNLITWAASLHCQETEVDGRIQAVAGFLYVYAYDDDALRITERTPVPQPDLAITDCLFVEHPISPAMAGRVAFGSPGGSSGWNPCGPNATCEVSPTLLEFGVVAPGEFAEQTFSVTNRFQESFSVSPVPFGVGYSIVGGGGETLLDPGESLVITVRFTPTLEGIHPGYVDLQGSTCAQVTCSGRAQSGCDLIPGLLDFGNVAVGQEAIEPLLIVSVGSEIISGAISFDTPRFSVASGDSLVYILPGDTLSVPIRFSPGAVGPVTGTLTVSGTNCGGVLCRGAGVTECGIAPASLDYGEVPVGAAIDLSLRLTNAGSSRLEGSVLLNCAEFHVISGGGAYSLGQGEFRDVVIRFTPSGVGTRACYLELEGSCDPVLLTGVGFAQCEVEPAALDFGDVERGNFAELGFSIPNPTQTTLAGTVMSSGHPFIVTEGGGNYTIPPGQSHQVTVRFAPTVGGLRTGTITYAPLCPPVECSGWSVVAGAATQPNAKIALHLTAIQTKNQCTTNAPVSVPCDEFVVQGQPGVSYAAYAIVAEANPAYGIGAVEFGLDYDEASGSGVGIFGWDLCGDWESPGAGWPESGGRNLIRWEVSDNCQNSYRPDLGFEGVQAIAGWFYVYAYDADILAVTRPSDASPARVEDCGGHATQLPWTALGWLRFGSGSTFNPCTYSPMVPVELLTLTARRMDGGAEIAWAIAGETEDVLGFRVHRESTLGDRVAVHEDLLSGSRTYVVTDSDVPDGLTRYWLAEYARTGEVNWHGPVLLEASPVVRPVLAQNHPNPFSAGTRIGYRVDSEGPVTLRVFDLAGREVARLVDRTEAPGFHEHDWDGLDATGQRVRAGIYLYRLETPDHVVTRKLVVLQ